jgi:hypothetical protein
LLDLVSKHLRKLQIKPDGFQNGLLTWCKVREGDTFLTFFMQMYLKNNAARAGSGALQQRNEIQERGKLEKDKEKTCGCDTGSQYVSY